MHNWTEHTDRLALLILKERKRNRRRFLIEVLASIVAILLTVSVSFLLSHLLG